MPPSGFNQNAINGLLKFIEVNYRLVQESKPDSMSEKQYLEHLYENMIIGTPIKDDDIDASVVSLEAVGGLIVMLRECFGDLAQEIEVGEDKHGRRVTEGYAIQKELDQIGGYLAEFTI